MHLTLEKLCKTSKASVTFLDHMIWPPEQLCYNVLGTYKFHGPHSHATYTALQ